MKISRSLSDMRSNLLRSQYERQRNFIVASSNPKLSTNYSPAEILALVRFVKFSHNVVPCHRLSRLKAHNNAFAFSYRKQLVVLLKLCFQKHLGLVKL